MQAPPDQPKMEKLHFHFEFFYIFLHFSTFFYILFGISTFFPRVFAGFYKTLNPNHLPAGELSANKKKEPIKRMDHTSTIEMGKIALQPKDKTPGVAKEQETPREQEKIGIFHL